MQNIYGTGTKVTIIAIPTFPAGITITTFPEDQDAVSIDNQDITEVAMGVNGDMVAWGRPTPINITLSVFPDSEDDKNLGILFDMNRIAKNKVSAQDKIIMTISCPGSDSKTFVNGVITGGPAGNSVSGNSRKQTKQYRFSFENKLN